VRQYLVELEEQNPVEEPVREQEQIVSVWFDTSAVELLDATAVIFFLQRLTRLFRRA
jgi:hypothetical protein